MQSAISDTTANSPAPRAIRGTPNVTVTPDGEIINRPEFARRLGVSERHVDYMVKTGRVAHLRLGTKSVRFIWPACLRSLESGGTK